jgi:hypothetical protein
VVFEVNDEYCIDFHNKHILVFCYFNLGDTVYTLKISRRPPEIERLKYGNVRNKIKQRLKWYHLQTISL